MDVRLLVWFVYSCPMVCEFLGRELGIFPSGGKECSFMEGLYIFVSFMPMIFCRMVFCKIICIIIGSFIPEENKLLLSLSISQPIIPHIPGF